MKVSLQQLSELTGARVLGNGTIEISGLATIDTATARDLVFVDNESRLEQALQSQAGAVLAGEFAATAQTEKPLLIHKDPRLAFARAARSIVPRRRFEPGVHSSALVHHSVKLGKQVTVQPHAVLAEGVIVGDYTRIGPGAAIGEGVQIGSQSNIAANVTIYPGTRIGDRVVLHGGAVLGGDGFGYVRDPENGRYEQFPQIGTLDIGDDVEIGSNTTIDRGALGATQIGRGTKIDNLVHIAHNVIVGDNVVIAAQTGISGSCVIQSNVVIAGQVGIADHVTIEEGTILGAQCGVPTGKVIRGKGILFWGTPARPIKAYLKELATLARLAKAK